MGKQMRAESAMRDSIGTVIPEALRVQRVLLPRNEVVRVDQLR
jgi:hypothetical protein